MTTASIPIGLWPHFQEYDPQRLDANQDADLIIQRTLVVRPLNFWDLRFRNVGAVSHGLS